MNVVHKITENYILPQYLSTLEIERKGSNECSFGHRLRGTFGLPTEQHSVVSITLINIALLLINVDSMLHLLP